MLAKSAILIYESIGNVSFDGYQNVFIDAILSMNSKPDYFIIDSFSSTENFQYAQQLFEKTEKILLLITFRSSKNVKGLHQLIQTGMNCSSNVSIISMESISVIEKVKAKLKVSIIEKTDDVLKLMKQWDQDNVKSSASF